MDKARWRPLSKDEFYDLSLNANKHLSSRTSADEAMVIGEARAIIETYYYMLRMEEVQALERIAEALAGGGVASKIDEVLNAPRNAYGENLVDAIQNGIERGQRGINTNDR